MIFYCGSYNKRKDSPGIYVCFFDEDKKEIKILGEISAGRNPSWISLDSQKVRMYAVNEITEGSEQASVSVFRVSPGGRYVSPLGSTVIPGRGPCQLAVCENDSLLFTADYNSGTVSIMELGSDGIPSNSEIFVVHSGQGKDPVRQNSAHIHSVLCDDKYLWCVDLGLDQVVQYPFNGKKKNEEYATKYVFEPGSGPREICFGSGRQVFVIEELANRISVLSKEGSEYEYSQMISTIPDDWEGENRAAHLEYNVLTNCYYASNRGHDSIAVFALQPGKKELKLKQHYKLKGKCPRHFSISPDGRFLVTACRNSNSLEGLKIRPDGRLEKYCIYEGIESPACIRFF